MPKPTVLFVHGTSVRIPSYKESLESFKEHAAQNDVEVDVVDCYWGDQHSEFEGLSLPKPVERTEAQAQAERRWDYLLADPLFELKLWCTPASEVSWGKFQGVSPSQKFWRESASRYQPTEELKALLAPYHLVEPFQKAWATVVASKVPEQAFEGGGAEATAIANAFAEALVAQMVLECNEQSDNVPPLPLRRRLVERLVLDWEMKDKGMLKDLLLKVAGVGTKLLFRPARTSGSKAAAPFVGDILHYLGNGDAIRQLFREKIANLPDPGFVVAHSLGGIVSVDVLAEEGAPKVRGLVTAGSQAPLMLEFGALHSMKGKKELPGSFPPWLNLYDENDPFGYCAARLFPKAKDVRVDSLLPPIHAHMSYWELPETWESIGKFLKEQM